LVIQETLTKRETQILQLRGECDHELMMVKLQAIQDNVRLKQEQDKIMKIHDDAVHEKALQLVDIKSNTIYGENVALVNRLRELEKEIRDAGISKEDQQDANKKLKMEHKIAEETVKEYSRQGMILGRDV
jgi:uncharacterized membrane protein YccC